AGHAPFRADSSLAVLRRVIEDEPRPLREVNPEVPAWLAAIVAKLHAKDPAGRFQSAQEVADLLGRCLAHVQRPDALPLPTIPAAPRRRRRPTDARWAALVCVGIVAAVAVVWPDGWFNRLPIKDATPQAQQSQSDPFPLPPWDM